jgi:hypothetical protein
MSTVREIAATDRAPSTARKEPEEAWLGTDLLTLCLVDEEQLAWARGVQASTGSPLRRILVASGAVRRLDIYRVLAARWG